MRQCVGRQFFLRTASKLAKADTVRTFVMVGSEGALIGFYATNAHAIDYTELPTRFARNRPAHGSIPAAYISMIGVDSRFQGRGYGGDLLIDCLVRIAGAAAALDIAVVMLDVLDCGDPATVAKRLALYTGYGFEPLPYGDGSGARHTGRSIVHEQAAASGTLQRCQGLPRTA